MPKTTKAQKTSKPKRIPAGRPSSYTPEIADQICERLAEGESLRTICKAIDMPGKTTVFRWLANDANEPFRDQYARAREMQADALADEILEIADTPLIGKKTVSKATGLEITEGDMVDHRRLQVDARKWYAAKLAPKKYGERQHIDMEVKDTTSKADRMKAARERAKRMA